MIRRPLTQEQRNAKQRRRRREDALERAFEAFYEDPRAENERKLGIEVVKYRRFMLAQDEETEACCAPDRPHLGAFTPTEPGTHWVLAQAGR